MSLPRKWLPAFLGTALAGWPTGALAERDGRLPDATGAIEPEEPHALGRVLTAGPTRTGALLVTSGGYGYTGAVLGTGDAHHRLSGALTLHERPLPWLDFALRFDGRYDAHKAPGQAGDSGMVGDPRFYARADRRWDGGLRVGLRAGLWLPGRNAPSLDASALSPELLAIASYSPASGPIAVTANLGYRLDRSARSAPDADRLSANDRLALAVSAFDQVLVGLGATIGSGSAQGFVEASADLLVGGGAPATASSPMFVAGGGRFAFGRNVRLEAAVEVSPSRRPDIGPNAMLSPIPPRFGAWLGLTYRFGGGATPPSPPPGSAAPPPVVPPAPPATATLAGYVSSSEGGTLADLRVEITNANQRREVTVDDEGRFSAEGKPGEEMTVSAETPNHLPARAIVTLRAGLNPLSITLERRPPEGHIRGLVRSLDGSAVAADIVIEEDPPASSATKHLRADDGRFEVAVAPGRYQVSISAAGYEAQRRKVEVDENGVTLLNVDLRRAR